MLYDLYDLEMQPRCAEWKGSSLDRKKKATQFTLQLLSGFFCKPSAPTDACVLPFTTI